ncbi:MAG: biopolymer transporter ExbD [Pseudomonadota bacterium]
MITFEPAKPRKERDSTIALINIVFLMLIFFLIAGTIVPPIDGEISPVLNESTENAELEGMLAIRADGSMISKGAPITIGKFATSFLESTESDNLPVRIFPDQETKAAKVLDIANQLRTLGIAQIRLVTERRAE